jgi:hypothetical protein
MQFKKQYHKLSYTDLEARKAFKQYLADIESLLKQYGLSLMFMGEVEYEYLKGNHILSVRNSQKDLTEGMQEMFDGFLQLAHDNQEETK